MANLVWLNEKHTKYTYKGFEKKLEFNVIEQVRNKNTVARLIEAKYLQANEIRFELIILKNGELVEKKEYKTRAGAQKRILKYLPIEAIVQSGLVN